MGYQITYEPIPKLRRVEKRRSRIAALTGICLLTFPGLTYALWPEGWEALRTFLLPGDPAVTAAALEELGRELKSGTELSDALQVFCHSILKDANFAGS